MKKSSGFLQDHHKPFLTSNRNQLVPFTIHFNHLAIASWCWIDLLKPLGFSQFNSIQVPILGTVSILGCRTISAVTLAVLVPKLAAVSPLNRRTVSAVTLVVLVPTLVAVSTLNRRSISAVEIAVLVPKLGAVSIYCYSVGCHRSNILPAFYQTSSGFLG
jgi:hypothetical protein